jgi:hypothetical protein
MSCYGIYDYSYAGLSQLNDLFDDEDEKYASELKSSDSKATTTTAASTTTTAAAEGAPTMSNEEKRIGRIRIYPATSAITWRLQRHGNTGCDWKRVINDAPDVESLPIVRAISTSHRAPGDQCPRVMMLLKHGARIPVNVNVPNVHSSYEYVCASLHTLNISINHSVGNITIFIHSLCMCPSIAIQ